MPTKITIENSMSKKEIDFYKKSILSKMKEMEAKDLSDKEITRSLKNTVAGPGLIRVAKQMRREKIITKNMLKR